jgi:hypothetical protein
MLFKPALLHFKLRQPFYRDDYFWLETTAQMDCNGNKWYMYMKQPSQNDPSEWTTLVIQCKIEKAIDAKFILCVRDNDGDI